MVHECTVIREDFELMKNFENNNRLKQWILRSIMIHESNPLCHTHFRSEMAIRNEKLKQINSDNWYIIHPLSKFSRWYDIWLIFLYLALCIIKPLDSCKTRGPNWTVPSIISFVFDIVSWSDIIIQFFLGYIESHTKIIQLQPKKVILKYLFSPYFLPDILCCAFPRFSLYLFFDEPYQNLLGVQVIFCLLRPIRIVSLIRLIYKLLIHTLFVEKIKVFIVCCIVTLFFTLHYTTCLEISVGLLMPKLFEEEHNTIDQMKFSDLYADYMFRSSAFLLGITLPKSYFESIEYAEEYIIAIVTFVVGKFLIVSTWIILAVNILNSRDTRIKFQGIMNQLDEYMNQKHFPPYLRNKIKEYYYFTYRKNYFKEMTITGMLSESIRKDISIDMCRMLVQKVSLFKNLTFHQLEEVIPLLKSQIFLECEVIFQAGTEGTSMYFLASGTVAVYTSHGKEICHLQDGAHFGEISLILKKQIRTTTVIAVEICQIYVLKRRDFKKTLLKNKLIFENIVRIAEKRLRETNIADEEQRRSIFQQTYSVPISKP